MRHQRQGIEAISALSTRTMVSVRPRAGRCASGAASVAVASAGHAFQLASVRTADSSPRPYQLCLRPCCSSSGTSVPDAATPRPTPAKITPPTRPRLPGVTCGRMVEAAKTMITPPVTPARNRQPKNQMNENGTEQAKQHSEARTIIPRNDRTAPNRVPSSRDQRAAEIAGQIGCPEINRSRRAEPFCGDQCRDQGRVSKAREPKPDQRCAQTCCGGQPDRPALLAVMGGYEMTCVRARHGHGLYQVSAIMTC